MEKNYETGSNNNLCSSEKNINRKFIFNQDCYDLSYIVESKPTNFKKAKEGPC